MTFYDHEKNKVTKLRHQWHTTVCEDRYSAITSAPGVVEANYFIYINVVFLDDKFDENNYNNEKHADFDDKGWIKNVA